MALWADEIRQGFIEGGEFNVEGLAERLGIRAIVVLENVEHGTTNGRVR